MHNTVNIYFRGISRSHLDLLFSHSSLAIGFYSLLVCMLASLAVVDNDFLSLFFLFWCVCVCDLIICSFLMSLIEMHFAHTKKSGL